MRYEFTHDSLAKQVFEKASGEARLRRKIEREIKEAYLAYRERGAKLTKEDVDYYEPFVGVVNITREEEAFIWEAKRKLKRARNRIVAFLVSTAVVLIGLTTWAILGSVEANRQAAIAEENQREAMHSDSLAQLRATEANEARDSVQKALIQARRSDSLMRIERDNAKIAETRATLSAEAAYESEKAAHLAQANAQSLLWANQAQQALEQGDRITALKKARDAWQIMETERAHEVLWQLSQTAIPARIEGRKILTPFEIPWIITSKGIYSDRGELKRRVDVEHIAFSKDRKQLLLICPRLLGRDTFEVIEASSLDQIVVFDRIISQQDECPKYASATGQLVLEVVQDGPDVFWKNWAMKDPSGRVISVFHGKLDDYSSIGPVDTEQVGDLISIRDNSGKWLLGLEVETEIGDHILAEDGEVLYEDPHSVKLFDIRNFPLSHFTYDASLPYAAPSSALYWTACGQVTVDNLEYADYVGDRDERKRGIQFYPEIGSILTWDRDLLDLEMYVNLQEMGEVLPYDWVGPPIYLWDIDELRLALPLHGSFKKVSFENDYIITESGGHVFVWDWDARLVIQEPATDIFVTRDARKYVVVRRDSTCETIYHGDTTNIGVRQFVAYDEGEMTFKTVEARGISGWSTGGPTQWSAEMEYIVWNWQGEPVREYSEEYSGTRFPSPERPGELLNNVAMNTVELEYVSVNGNSVLVDDGFDQRTYQLGEDGLGVIGAPDRKKFLAVTRSGKAKIWTIELNFDPDAYLSKFKWLNDD